VKLSGTTEKCVTTGAEKVNWSALDAPLVPFAVVTVTSTVPALWAGDVAVIEVELLTANELAAVPPKLTAVTPTKFVPVMVTLVAPAVVPPEG
jgi:hypothetical protein